ncbi:splicing factor, Prp19-binding domain-containing protein [Panaeolus papilionaceus]|nr:splicing factor, Prp19-binding domain-containing protein [Panaeolus papilionaceus]
MSTARKPAARLPRPAVRYWKGKAPKGAVEADSDSDAEEQNNEVGDVEMGDYDEEEDVGELAINQRQDIPKSTMNIALKDVSVSKDGRVIVAGREESGRTALEESGEEESSEEESDEEERPKVGGPSKVADDESSEYESSSEEESEPEFRPVFVPKRARETIAEKEKLAMDSEETQRKREEEAEERRKQSHDLVALSIKRELAEKEKENEIPDVDDTDGLDPAAEFEAWRLRELGRIKKEKEDEVAREKEREEVERRRAMPEEQRLKEDLERAQKLREEKPKGQQKFLQKYWHKGAFHQDEEILKRHDFTEATESTVDVSLLPKVMQVKNFGKRSRTKYTHLLDQDTTAAAGGFGGTGPVKAGGSNTEGGGCFLCGGPHMKKDCPQNPAPGLRPSGPPGERDTRHKDDGYRNRDRDSAPYSRSRDEGYKHRDESYSRSDRDRDRRPRDDRGDRDRGWSRRSRSPPRRGERDRGYPEDNRSRRRHSRERSVEHDRDKRRRLE